MLTNEELMCVKGGGITAALISAVTKAFEKIYELGRIVGSAIRRISDNKICQVK